MVIESQIPAYTEAFNKRIHYVFNIPEEDIEKKPFEFGGQVYYPGHRFEKLGDNPRSTFRIEGKDLIYEGRIGCRLLFKVDEKWPIRYHIDVVYISPRSLHMMSSRSAGWDITLKYYKNTKS